MASPDQGDLRPATSFADLHIHPEVLRAVDDVGYESPSAVQAATIPAMMAGSDVVGLAQTGTGKTAAFAMPILSKIDTASTDTQALVLAPTRELALQVAEAFRRYGAHLPRINVLPIYGGQSYGVQLAGLKRGAQVVVGTPGRVIDHLERGTLDLSPAGLPGARRGRRDADDGLRRRRRTHPRRHPRVQAGGAVLGDHAAGHPQAQLEIPARPRRNHRRGENRLPRRTFRSATSRWPAPARWTR